jgi:hypothetical protein
MLIDGGAAINLTLYSIFKKLGRDDEELVNTNLTLNGIGGNSMEARGVVSMELIEVQGIYSVILGCDWIRANRCINSLYFAPILDSIDR